jgi:hypothetical protein
MIYFRRGSLPYQYSNLFLQILLILKKQPAGVKCSLSEKEW